MTSHGRLASGLKNTLEFFLEQSETIAVADVYVDTSSDYLQQLQRPVDSAEVGKATIFTDIYKGSTNQQASMMVMESEKDIPVITDMNLLIVLSAAMTDDSSTIGRMGSMLKECQLQLVKMPLYETKEDDGGEFFA